jgi:hypothetical protein
MTDEVCPCESSCKPDLCSATAATTGRAGWDALLAAMRWGVGERRDRRVVEGGDMAVIADHHPGAVGGEGVAGDHDPRHGGDVDQR